MISEFTLGRAKLSSWYVAILISFFAFQPLKGAIVSIANFAIRVLNNILAIKIQDDNGLWVVQFGVCFIFTFIIQKLFVSSLGIQVKKDGGQGIELWLTVFLLSGLYLFVLNKVFTEQAMPTFFPNWAVYLFGGAENTYLASSIDTNKLAIYGVVQGVLWNLGPMIVLWIGSNIQKS